jgi:phosphatidylglycerol---prolipoprotein diacylglyceryl transferase
MYPILFRIGSFEITSFGVMVALAAALGMVMLRREMLRSGLDASKGIDAALVGVLGGLAGAKLLYVVEHLSEPLSSTVLSRAGMSWFGGLTGGVLAGIGMIVYQGLPLMAVLAAAAPALTLGHAVGRIGCFLVGDDYGRVTSLPWGIAFPEGLPPTTETVHPTQLYESIPLFIITFVLVRLRRRGTSDRTLFGVYLLAAGSLRFAIELVRVNVVVLWGLTTAQLFSIAIVLIGSWLLVVRPAPQAEVLAGPTAGGAAEGSRRQAGKRRE